MSTSDYGSAYPNSRKVWVEGEANGFRLAVPMREITLSNGDRLRVYDTSGPLGRDPREGLPPMRAERIAARDVETVTRPGGRRELLGHSAVTKLDDVLRCIIT